MKYTSTKKFINDLKPFVEEQYELKGKNIG
jgi:hypothetical protein